MTYTHNTAAVSDSRVNHTRRSFGRYLTAVIAAVALLGSTAVAVGRSVIAQEATQVSAGFTLTILHNNDGESKLVPDEGDGFPGVARFVSAMKELQAQAGSTSDGVITLTSGDNFLASKELNVSLTNLATPARGPFYDAVALSGLYDAMALGNHDFDLGPDVAVGFMSAFTPAVPFLSANIDYSNEPLMVAMEQAGRLAASEVFDYDGVSVGVIGAVTPKLPNISTPRNVIVNAVAPAVNAEAAELTAQGVNIIILISHLQSVKEELELIPTLSNVDVVIAGGGDELLSNDASTCLPEEDVYGMYPLTAVNADGDAVPVITGPGGYRCIGHLDVRFDGDGTVLTAEGRSIGVALDGTPDPDVQSSVVEPLQAALNELETNVIATSDVPLDGRRSMVRTTETNVGNLMADATLINAQNLAASFGVPRAQVGLQNGGGIRNDSVIEAGNITTADTFDIAPFSNFIGVVEVPRDTFKNLLEQAVDCVPGTCGQFAQLAGLTMVYDPAQPAREIDRDGECDVVGDTGSRVREVTLDDGTAIVRDGQVVEGPAVVLATIDFLAGGGDCYPLGGLEFTKLGLSYQASLAQYISDVLGGRITATQYPQSGTGRIVSLADGVPTPPVPPSITLPGAEETPEPDATAG